MLGAVDAVASNHELNDAQPGGFDCHNIVKSSGLTSKKRFCCDHGHKCLKATKISVACQTDPNENDIDYSSISVRGHDVTLCQTTSDQQTVAHDLGQKDDDAFKPEGILRLMIHNFRNMNDTVRGPAKLVSGVPWKIMVMPRQHVVAKKGTQKCLGFFLQCCPDSYSDSWSCQAAAELRLISQKHGVPNFVRKTNHVYTAKENDWGYSCFMTWADILDESQGYMKDESVILEVFVRAESPKGILTYEAFCKKIQDYMRLSDMQCSRNLIDKALEVNQTALKFCKDKDELMKEELEKQKTRLIERKLMQSIERIEKDSKTVDSGDGGNASSKILNQYLAGHLAGFKDCAAALMAQNAKQSATSNAANSTKESVNNGNETKNTRAKSDISSVDVQKDAIKHAQKMKRASADDSDIKKRSDLKQTFKTTKDFIQTTESVGEQQNSDMYQAALEARRKALSALALHRDTNSMPVRRRSTGGSGALVELFDLDEPCCSDHSEEDEEDDDSDYEDIDEVCDGCLVEKLDNMSGVAPVLVDAQDTSCQTDFQPYVNNIGTKNLSSSAPIAVPSAVSNNFKSNTVAQPTMNPLMNSKFEAAAAALKLSPPTLKTLKQKLMYDQKLLGEAESDELLKLITKESKASLNTIKDTLEKLLTKEGQNFVLGSNGEIAQPPSPFDFVAAAAMATARNTQQMKDDVKTDVVDIAAPMLVENPDLVTANITTTSSTATATLTSTVVSNQTATPPLVVTATAQQQPPVNSPAIVAQSVIKKTLQQQQQLMDVNQQMVQIKQIVEFKRQQQQQQQQIYRELTAAHQQQLQLDEEQQRQQQQFVQTDLSYVPRAPSPITEEDYTLLRHAKEIVENRAEEFSRYSQIIEKSEYDRLAETVKKVEKRMREIEKQTMTCRKQLADENERNYREEQKLVKANKQLKQQLDQANEKVEKLNAQLRERRAEIKKMEKKLKAECQTSAENAELNSRIEQLERDLALARQKHSEEKQRLVDENQRLNEIKKNLQQELSCATNEVERLHAQLEDKSSAIRKHEANYKQEKQQAQTSLKEATDRAKKAEINLLEFKLEMFSKTLQRSHEDCRSHISQLEDLLKRATRDQPNEDLKWLTGFVQEWQKVRDKVYETQYKMKNDFMQQIDLVKSGKSLTSLPILDLPKPIPFPPAPKQLHALLHEPKQPIAPIGVHPAASNVLTNGVGPLSGNARQAPSSLTSNQQLQQSSTVVPPLDNHQVQGPVSVNGDLSSTQSVCNGPTVSQTAHFDAYRLSHFGTNNQSQARTDFTPWSDPLQGLTQSLLGNKSVASMFDNFPSQSASRHGPLPPTLNQQPPQWVGGWPASFSTPPPPLGSLYNVQNVGLVQNGLPLSIDEQQQPSFMRSASRQQAEGSSPQPTMESLMESTITSDKSKQIDSVIEQIKTVFPNSTTDNIRDCVHEFRSLQFSRSLKGLTGDQLFNGVLNVIYSRQNKQAPPPPAWIMPPVAPPFQIPPQSRNMVPSPVVDPYANQQMGAGGLPSQSVDATSVGAQQSNTYESNSGGICGVCRTHTARGLDACKLACAHVFHAGCLTPWLSKNSSCPTCGVLVSSAEDFPDLA